MKTRGIYSIVNKITGRVYVGSSRNMQARWSEHASLLRAGRHHSIRLQRSWDKYGRDSFEFSILELVHLPVDLFPREQYWIDLLRAACPKRGANSYPAAGSPLGTKRSPEQRAALSLARRGIPKSPEHVAKMISVHLGAKRSDEARAKMSAIHKGKTISDDQKAKLSAALKGRVFSPETIEKMKEGRRLTRERKRAAPLQA